ncbi:Golgin sub A member 7 [Coemansia sp. RSA 2599]|nr:Golgin sub A member 7 [Coemansia sp. RSA 2598]KAJ1820705.1 Golgin sub A member 7 [Coemansia sp. RSA 2599]
MSIADSSEHWSFENLTQSTDSGYPLLSSTDPQHLDKQHQHHNQHQHQHQHQHQQLLHNPPLSVVLGSEIRSKNSHTLLHRSPSGSSTHAYLRRNNQQPGQRPDSFASETFSIHTIQQQPVYQYKQPQQNPATMFATPESNRMQYRSASSSTNIGGTFPTQPQASYSNLTPRSSLYSDRAVYVASKSPDNTDQSAMSNARAISPPSPVGAASPAPTSPLAAAVLHTKQRGEELFQPELGERNRSQSIVALSSTSNAAATTQQNWDAQTFFPARMSSLGGAPAGRDANAAGGGRASLGDGMPSDPLAYKSYSIPQNADAVPQNALEHSQWQRIRVERDYSMGTSRQFLVKVPEQLVGKIDEQRFKKFVRRINTMLAEAEGATLRNVLEGCLAFATLYMSTLFLKSHFKKTVEQISALVYSENESLFRPAGFLVIDPKQTAYMFIEIVPL